MGRILLSEISGAGRFSKIKRKVNREFCPEYKAAWGDLKKGKGGRSERESKMDT